MNQVTRGAWRMPVGVGAAGGGAATSRPPPPPPPGQRTYHHANTATPPTRVQVTGRARLGGQPVGVIAVETATTSRLLPADPGMPDSSEMLIPQAGQVRGRWGRGVRQGGQAGRSGREVARTLLIQGGWGPRAPEGSAGGWGECGRLRGVQAAEGRGLLHGGGVATAC